MRVWFVLLLLVAPVAAQSFEDQDTESDSVYAPIQLLLDQFPAVMDLAISESDLDGTPHDANELVRQMQAFFAGFEDRPAWPEGSEAAETEARAAFGRIGAMLDAAKEIPDRIGSLSRVDAACTAAKDPSGGQAQAWWTAAFGDVDELDLLRGSLTEMAAEIEAPLRQAPVVASMAALNDWVRGTATEVQFCVEEALLRANLAVPATSLIDVAEGQRNLPTEIRLRVAPNPAFPGQTVYVTGRVVGPRGPPADIDAPSLGWSQAAEVSGNGAFEATFRVPTGASLGGHAVTAASNGIVGEEILMVAKAPVFLDITAPQTVFPGTQFAMRASAHSPLPLPAGATFTINGDAHPITGIVLRHRAQDEPTTLRYVVAYPGDARHESVSKVVVIEVKFPPIAEPAEPSPWTRIAEGVWAAPIFSTVVGQRGEASAPDIAAGAIMAIIATVLFFMVAELALSARRLPEDLEAPEDIDELPRRTQWPRSFAAAFAMLAGFILRLRILPAGATARDIGRHLQKRRLGHPSMVRDFELVRYGKRTMPERASVHRSHLLGRLWRRLGGQ